MDCLESKIKGEQKLLSYALSTSNLKILLKQEVKSLDLHVANILCANYDLNVHVPSDFYTET